MGEKVLFVASVFAYFWVLLMLKKVIPFMYIKKKIKELINCSVVIIGLGIGLAMIGMPDTPSYQPKFYEEGRNVEEFMEEAEEFKKQNGYYHESYYEAKHQINEIQRKLNE